MKGREWRIAVSGCRDAGTVDLAATLQEEKRGAWFPVMVLVGDCPTGVDAQVRAWCEYEGVAYTVFYADWDIHGKAAGPIRNREMVAEAHVLLAFWDGKSRGTLSAIREAVKAGVDVRIYPVRTAKHEAASYKGR